MNKKLLTIAFVLLACVSFAQSNYHTPYDPGAVRKTDQALRLDTTNASISENLDVAGNVGAATINGVAPLTAAEKMQALVGSSTVNFAARNLELLASGATTTYTRVNTIKITTLATDTAVNIVAMNEYETGSILVVDSTNVKYAKYYFHRVTTVEEQDPDTVFSPTKDNPGTINVYVEAGYLVMQNKTTGAVGLRVSVMRLAL